MYEGWLGYITTIFFLVTTVVVLFDNQLYLRPRLKKSQEENEKLKKQIVQHTTIRYPRPAMVKQIESTIKDFIDIQLNLSVNQKVNIGKTMIVKITDDVCKTYPTIDKNYISEKVVAMIQNMT
jgi:hypothetical protein